MFNKVNPLVKTRNGNWMPLKPPPSILEGVIPLHTGSTVEFPQFAQLYCILRQKKYPRDNGTSKCDSASEINRFSFEMCYSYFGLVLLLCQCV
jgi:hypothetical protein